MEKILGSSSGDGASTSLLVGHQICPVPETEGGVGISYAPVSSGRIQTNACCGELGPTRAHLNIAKAPAVHTISKRNTIEAQWILFFRFICCQICIAKTCLFRDFRGIFLPTTKMESPAAKRRRTSPRIAANNSTVEASAEAAPQSGARRTRPDFASPTKASLARHNPEILARRKSTQRSPKKAVVVGASSAAPAGDDLEGVDEDPRASSPGSSHSEESLSQLLTTQLEEGSVIIERGSTPASQRSRPVARPLPPPAPGGEELVDLLQRRSTRRRDVTQRSDPDAEPELPPTPSQLGLEEPGGSTPPSGIHSSSPSRKKMKRRIQQQQDTEKRSSPLKKPPMRPDDLVPPTPTRKKDLLANPQATPRLKTIPIHSQRRVRPEDIHVEKLQHLEELRQEEQALAEDLNNITAWNKELWDRVLGDDRDELAEDFLDDEKTGWVHAHLLEDHEKRALAPDPSASLLQAAQNPAMWLPFSDAATVEGALADEEPEDFSGIVSHHPLKMTADEERPYLQAFSPLTFTSTPPMRVERDERQEYYFRDITVRATAMPTLFVASIVLIVDEQMHQVEELRVPRLDRNAEAELRPFIDSVVAPKRKRNRATDRNVSIISWAMGEWYQTALRRARFWYALAQEKSRPSRAAEKGPAEKELLPYMGCLSRVLPLSQWGDDASVRIEWKISFDWTGEAKSKVGLAFSGPAECKSPLADRLLFCGHCC